MVIFIDGFRLSSGNTAPLESSGLHEDCVERSLAGSMATIWIDDMIPFRPHCTNLV